MESQETPTQLDTEFDRTLVEMKPHVLRLPHKSERQKCALWIKKFCEPQPSGVTGRKNRNLYAQLLLQMLKRGRLEGPFTDKPQTGPLPPLPSHKNQMPDWVAGELGGELSGISSISSDLPPASSANRNGQSRIPPTDTQHNMIRDRDWTRGGATSPTSAYPKSHGSRPAKPVLHLSSDDELSSEEITRPKTLPPPPPSLPAPRSEEWRGGLFNSTTFASSRGSLFRDEVSSFNKGNDKELDVRVKMIEGRFQEEKLRLQQKHDSTVQKILDRKNTEIEDLKVHYRNKTKEQEEHMTKLERKVHTQHKELAALREAKEEQIEDLRKLAEENTVSKHNELEKKLHDCMAEFEKEKFDMQKAHTKNIQELLDDTNARLAKMEAEYSEQVNSTSALIQELETRVHQLSAETEGLNKLRVQLELEKTELENRVERQNTELQDYLQKFQSQERELRKLREECDQELRSLKNKHEANLEYVRQENNLSHVKAADSISELEQHVAQLKQALDQSEQQRIKQGRETDELHQQDRRHLENLHEKKVRSLKQEMDQVELESQKKLRKLEQAIRDREEQVSRLVQKQDDQNSQADKALEEFRGQVEQNTAKMYEDMKQQMTKVESDLNRTKQVREKQAREAQKQLAEQQHQYEQKMTEMRVDFEREKARLMRQFHSEKEQWVTEKDKEMESLKGSLQGDLSDVECRLKDRQERDAKMIAELEQTVHALQEEVVQANQLRKQQLVELGLLREEEKQKVMRDHEAQMARLRSENQQHRLEVDKKHSIEIEQVLEKTNAKLKEIEREYSSRSLKSNETVIDLNKTIQQLQGEVSRQQDATEQRVSAMSAKMEDDRRKLKQHHSAEMMTIHQEVESQSTRVTQLERKLSEQEHHYEDQLTILRGQYEDKLRGLIPASVRQELEDTIASLRQQVHSLQQRAQLLHEELEASHKLSMQGSYGPLGGSSGILTLGSTSSLKSVS